MKVGRVIRTADERTGSDVLKSFFARNLAIKIELLRRDEFDHRQMVRRRTQILAHRQNLAAGLAQIIHRLKNLRFGFAETEHDPAFGYYFRRKFLGPPYHLQRRSFLSRRWTDRG